MKKILPKWPKPKFGKIRTLRECDLMGGVGPVPVYPVTSTKAVFNTKNENLEDILQNGIKFHEDLWVKNLYVQKVAPYIEDGNTADELSNIIFDNAGNINMNMLGEGQVILSNEDHSYTMTISPSEIRIASLSFNENVIITDGISQFQNIKLTEIEEPSNPWALAGFAEAGTFGAITLGEGLTFNEYTELELNIGDGLAFENGKLICTVEASSGEPSCNCSISNTQFDDTNGVELFTFNSTKIYGPKIDVKSTQNTGTFIGSVNGTKFYAPTSEMSVDSPASDSKEEIATVNGAPIYSYKYFDMLAPRNLETYTEGEWGTIGMPYIHNEIYLYGYGITHGDNITPNTSLPIVFTQHQYTAGNPDSTLACPFCYISPGKLEVRNNCKDNDVVENRTSRDETFPNTFLNITPDSFKYNNEDLCVPTYSNGVEIATIAGKTIYAPESSGSGSLTIDSPMDYSKTYYLCSTEGLGLYENSNIEVDPENNTIIATDTSITATAFYQSSDIRLKENIEDINIPLETLLSIPTVGFNFIDNDKHHVGTIAQEVEKVCPEIVNTDKEGYKSVDYAKLSILALKGLKDMNERVNRLEGLINEII